jgi:amidase
MTDLTWLDGTAQADLVRRGEVTAAELAAAAIERINELNPRLNAVVLNMFEEGRKTAAVMGADGPLAGVPFLVKNILCSGVGEPVTMGMRAFAESGYRQPHDTYLARRFRDAGLITLGKTNTPEFALKGATEPEVHGPTHNPWQLGRSPGGSSGGSAAAVASGMVPLAHASDGGGSIRIPASACGLVGLKPSRGRVSLGPDAGEMWHGFACELGVTRSTRDTAALLDIAHGFMPGDPYAAPTPMRPYREEIGADPGRLRIGLMDRAPSSWPALHEDCVAAARDAARLLEELGHVVEHAHPRVLDELDYRSLFYVVVTAHTHAALEGAAALLGRPLGREDTEEWTHALGELGGRQRTAEYLRNGSAQVHLLTREVARWFAEPFGPTRYDLLLSPTLRTPPPPHGAMTAPPGDPLATRELLMDLIPFTPVANMTGQPAISLPLYWNPEGLPIGVHLMAQYGREDVLLRVASQLESARPWRDRRPGVCAG